ncbi:MAG TPA: hypothetical protein VF148_05035 [Acidimicrobiia bacterium]
MRATRLDETLFDDLASTSGEDLISVFLPTHKKGRDVNQDRIRLKNLLATVEETLADLGWKPRQREERLARAHGVLDDLEFWEHQEAGLAFYIDDGGAVVPVASTRTLASNAFVMPVFMLRPLTAELSDPTFPVLALTKDEVSLFSSSRFGVEEIPAQLPSYEDVNWFVDREKERQQHPDIVGTDRSRHGHDPSARRDEDLARFLREVDSAIERFDKTTPLVVLGDDEVVARFADVSERATLSPAHSGIRAPFSTDEIMEKIRPLVSEFESDLAATAETAARDQLGVGMAAIDVEDAVPAAVAGRVDSVLIDRNAPVIWGRLDKVSMEVEVHSDREPGDVDLLDRLVVWARDSGADVISTESISDGTPFIATFRY